MLFTSVPSFGAPGSQHHLARPVLDERADLIDRRSHGNRARVAAAIGDNAEGAAVVAAVLDLHEGAGAAAQAVDAVKRRLPNREDVVDGDRLAAVDAQPAPGLGLHLGGVADHLRDAGQAGEALGLDLRGAAGHDDASLRVLARELADRLPGLTRRLRGDGAGVDDDEVRVPGGLGLGAHGFRLVAVEPAAERDDLDRHHAAPAKSAGANTPSHSNSTGPVMST
jgi:hypothetical protein